MCDLHIPNCHAIDRQQQYTLTIYHVYTMCVPCVLCMCAVSIPYNPIVNSVKSQLHVQNHIGPHEKDSGYVIGSYFNPNIEIRVQGVKGFFYRYCRGDWNFFEVLTPCWLFSGDFLIFSITLFIYRTWLAGGEYTRWLQEPVNIGRGLDVLDFDPYFLKFLSDPYPLHA